MILNDPCYLRSLHLLGSPSKDSHAFIRQDQVRIQERDYSEYSSIGFRVRYPINYDPDMAMEIEIEDVIKYRFRSDQWFKEIDLIHELADLQKRILGLEPDPFSNLSPEFRHWARKHLNLSYIGESSTSPFIRDTYFFQNTRGLHTGIQVITSSFQIGKLTRRVQRTPGFSYSIRLLNGVVIPEVDHRDILGVIRSHYSEDRPGPRFKKLPNIVI